MVRMWKNTVFLRLFVTFLLILVPIYFIGLNIYNWGVRLIRNEIYNSMTAQTKFYVNGLEAEIERLRILQYECINNENLNTLTYASQTLNNFERFQALLRLQQHLYAIKNSSDYVYDVTARITALNVTVSALNGVSKGAINGSAKYSYLSPLSQLIYNNGTFLLNLSIPSNSNSGHTAYQITIDLPETHIREDLMQLSTYPESFSIMTDFADKLLILAGDTGNKPDKELSGGEAYEGIKGMKQTLLRNMQNSPSGIYYENTKNQRYIVIYVRSDYLGMGFAGYIPESQIFTNLKSYKIWLWIFSLASLVIIVLFSLSLYSFIHKPLRNLVKAFKNVENGDLKALIPHNHVDEFRYLYSGFNTMVSNLDTLIDQAYRQKILMQNAQLKQLQAQINPHFLYNTFFILYSMASAEDNESLMVFLKQLGNYFKFITRSGENEVPLSKEIEHARTYTSIQELRFSKRIRIEFGELPEKYSHLSVPRLIVQPIIENSFKYGLEEKESDGFLSVLFKESNGRLQIIVDDNGAGMDTSDMIHMKNALSDEQYSGETTGIVNIHRRLQLKFGEKSGLSVSHNETGGLRVIINIELGGDGSVQTIGG